MKKSLQIFLFLLVSLQELHGLYNMLPSSTSYSLEEKHYILSTCTEKAFTDSFRKLEFSNLWISASRQPSPSKIQELAHKAHSLGKKLYIIDLREEPHFFLRDATLTYYNGIHNSENAGLSLDAIRTKDVSMKHALLQKKQLTAYTTVKKIIEVNDSTTKKVAIVEGEEQVFTDSLQTEEEYMQKIAGVVYTRVPCTDHAKSISEETVKSLLTLLDKAQEEGDVWLHFHCRGGKKRSSAIILISYLFMSRVEEQTPDEILQPLLALEEFYQEKRKYPKLAKEISRIYTNSIKTRY